jgi:hypothetical protein
MATYSNMIKKAEGDTQDKVQKAWCKIGQVNARTDYNPHTHTHTSTNTHTYTHTHTRTNTHTYTYTYVNHSALESLTITFSIKDLSLLEKGLKYSLHTKKKNWIAKIIQIQKKIILQKQLTDVSTSILSYGQYDWNALHIFFLLLLHSLIYIVHHLNWIIHQSFNLSPSPVCSSFLSGIPRTSLVRWLPVPVFPPVS